MTPSQTSSLQHDLHLIPSPDTGVPVYVYEFQHSPLMHGSTRPTFVKAYHYDDALFFLGACFCTGHNVVTGTGNKPYCCTFDKVNSVMDVQ